MILSNNDVHDIKNNLTITIGLLNICNAKIKKLEQVAPKSELDAINDRIRRSIEANEKILNLIEELKAKEQIS